MSTYQQGRAFAKAYLRDRAADGDDPFVLAGEELDHIREDSDAITDLAYSDLSHEGSRPSEPDVRDWIRGYCGVCGEVLGVQTDALS